MDCHEPRAGSHAAALVGWSANRNLAGLLAEAIPYGCREILSATLAQIIGLRVRKADRASHPISDRLSAVSEWRVICSEPMTFPKSSVDPVGIGFWFYFPPAPGFSQALITQANYC